jgi:hypothetical protein
MRFAFKTAPQHTTWADMLAVWQAADGIEIFESGWALGAEGLDLAIVQLTPPHRPDVLETLAEALAA